ncbi:hypothetical protein FOL47_007791, partial [Perkinsus chesapeaki]
SGIVLVEVKSVKPIFDYLEYTKGLVHTPDEETEHFSRFEKELNTLNAAISHDDMVELFDETRPVVMQSLVDEINSKQSTWTASVDQGRFRGVSLRDAKMLCGSFMETKKHVEREDQVAFKQCKNVIGHIWDQSHCGDCWAFGTVNAFNDRVCIALNGADQTLLSPGYMSACCNKDHNCSSHGCGGGYPRDAWKFLHTYGSVVITCQRMNEKRKMDAGRTSSPSALTTLTALHYQVAAMGRYYTTKLEPDALRTNESIKHEIMTNGPVSASYYVYEDFFAYKSGVYKHTTGTHGYGHVVKIIGWGKEEGEDYWLVVNSWNDGWGDHGLFKIGINECNITDNVLSGYPNLPRKQI